MQFFLHYLRSYINGVRLISRDTQKKLDAITLSPYALMYIEACFVAINAIVNDNDILKNIIFFLVIGKKS